MDWLGITWGGIGPSDGRKLGLSIGLILCLVVLRVVLGALTRLLIRGNEAARRARFWTRQGINLFVAVVLIFGLASIWFDNPAKLATAAGLVSAGLAFALQRVVTAIAGYFVILRGNNFTVGDRITMGGVRGDVIALGFIQTTIMEMGEPPAVQEAAPAVWVRSRQFTGRIVTVSNAKIFDEPVFNYTRDFPYIWEEMVLPVSYKDDRARAEEILLDAARRHAIDPRRIAAERLRHLEAKYQVRSLDMEPRVFWRLTDNWLELALRFVTEAHGTRAVKDAMSRQILAGLDAAGIGIASSTYDVVGFPPIEIRNLASVVSMAAARAKQET